MFDLVCGVSTGAILASLLGEWVVKMTDGYGNLGEKRKLRLKLEKLYRLRKRYFRPWPMNIPVRTFILLLNII